VAWSSHFEKSALARRTFQRLVQSPLASRLVRVCVSFAQARSTIGVETMTAKNTPRFRSSIDRQCPLRRRHWNHHRSSRRCTYSQIGAHPDSTSLRLDSGESLRHRDRHPMKMRILHTMLRVTDLERSLHFYREVLGMQLLARRDYPEGRFTLAFLGYGSEAEETVLELTHNWDTKSYELGTAFGHLAIGVDDVYAAVETMRQAGAKVVREPGPMKNGTSVLAFIEDPDGYRIEILASRRPSAQASTAISH
jgi:lactoylglutathione lyase